MTEKPPPPNPRKIARIVLAAVMLSIAGGLLMYRLFPASGVSHLPTKAYYYDLETGELFAGPMGDPLAIPAPSKKKQPDGSDSGVQAHVFACGKCDDATQRKIGYLETYTALGAEALLAANRLEGGGDKPGAPPPKNVSLNELMTLAAEGHMIGKPEKPVQWMVSNSGDANELITAARNSCAGSPATECFP